MSPKQVYLTVFANRLQIVSTKGLVVAQQMISNIEFTGKSGKGKGNRFVMVTKDANGYSCHTIATFPEEATHLLESVRAAMKARVVTPPRLTLMAKKKPGTSPDAVRTPLRRPEVHDEMTPEYTVRSVSRGTEEVPTEREARLE